MKFKSKRKVNKGRRPFRFLAAWLTYKDFPELMNRAWPTENGWCSQVRQFQGSVCTWNKHVFGNNFERKRSLIHGLEDVDKRLNVSPSLILEEEQKSL